MGVVIEHVEIIERSTVVLSLRGYLESLRLMSERKIRIGGGALDVRDEIKRAHKMIDRFTNKWVYLSDDVLDISKLYEPTILLELRSLAERAVIQTGTYPYQTIDIAATNRMQEIAIALTENIK